MISSVSLEDKMKLLQLVFRRYDGWAQRRGYVCQPGCFSCCTTKVTMTELEGELILAHCKSQWASLHRPAGMHAPSWRPGLTANQLASCCLRGVWPEHEEETEHPAALCCFLNAATQCSIYAVRPLACRVMASSIDCRLDGCAEVPAVHITVSAALSQLIEHIDQGNTWGNMDDILRYLKLSPEEREEYRHSRLLVCEASPGWLIPDAEGVEVVSFLHGILEERFEGHTVGEVIGLGIIV